MATSTPDSRQPYSGKQRKLIIAFDIGTTFSGVSYALLDPGVVPVVEGVTRFPAQQRVGGDSKIPSVVCYARDGSLLAVGEEAVQYQEAVTEDEEEDEWSSISTIVKVEWFKLHFRPDLLPPGTRLPPLPAGKTAWNVYADFLGYLYRCTCTYITESRPTLSWESLGSNIEFILTHPNGWEGTQQSQMRRAAVAAGLVSADDAGERIQFVTEGEASLHFCVNKGIMNQDVLPDGEGCIIVDAGGGTVDISAYTRGGKTIREIAPSACCMEGSVMVTRRAGSWLQDNLRLSKFGSPQDVAQMTAIFDKTTKISFRNASEPSYIRFGRAADRDLRFDIRSGQKKIPGPTLASFFQPVIDAVVEAVLRQRREAQNNISHVFLVGGFAASDWLFSELQSRLSSSGQRLSRPDGHVNKAVADGAISFYVDHLVSARVTRMTYGVSCNIPYDDGDSEHVRRRHLLVKNLMGEDRIPDAFDTVLRKGTEVSETKEFRRPYFRLSTAPNSFTELVEDVLCYKGTGTAPRWVDKAELGITTACRVKADTSALAKSLSSYTGPNGQSYYRIDFDVVLLFGLIELKAEVRWKHKGKEKKSPANIIYDADT